MKEAKLKQLNFLKEIKMFMKTQELLSKKDERIIKMDEILERIKKLEEIITQRFAPKEGERKAKMKEKIIALLEKHKKLTSSQLSKLLGLSRTRCNEYFRELTREGITEGVVINRKKYYKLVKK